MDLRPLITADDAMATDQRQLLAPGRFRQILIGMARRYGRAVVMVDKDYTSRYCQVCGATARRGTADRTCAAGHRNTRPEMATTELLRRWREQRGDGGSGGTARGRHRRGITEQSVGHAGTGDVAMRAGDTLLAKRMNSDANADG